jgi:2,4-dienoyl-CoA reductase-like NADH-dependent reductase (Old Yellow Enzyme family)
MSVRASPIAPLLEPLTIRGMTLTNRLAMAPMTRSFCPDGVPGQVNVDYYRRRAEGQTGLIVTEAIGVDHPASVGDTGLGETDLPLFGADGSVEAWRKVTDAVHAAGAKILPQAWHQGVMRLPNSFRNPHVPNFAPSGRYGDRTKAADHYREMAEKLDVPTPVPTDEEIVDVVESFGRAAEEAMAAGFDGFAFHGAHGYLIDAFLWEETNQRTDRWGGDRKRRTVFACELIRRVRRAIGEDRPIIFRFSQWKQQDFKAKLGHTPAELEEVLGPMADAGVDLFDASVRYFDTPAFAGSDMSLAGWAKKLTGKLSGAVGGIGFDKGMYDTYDPVKGGTKSEAEGTNNLPRVLRRFEAGEFDIVSIGRALLSDPDWSRKASTGEPFSAFNFEALKSLI